MTPYQIVDGMNITEIKSVACDVALLSKYIVTSDAAALEQLSRTLCNLTDPEMLDLVTLVQSEMDMRAVLAELEGNVGTSAVYGVLKAINDAAAVIGKVLNSSLLAPYKDQLPPVLTKMEQWLPHASMLVKNLTDGGNVTDWSV